MPLQSSHPNRRQGDGCRPARHETLEALRARHPRLTYRGYEIIEDGADYLLRFELLLEPDISFTPEVRLPRGRPIDHAVLENLVFHLGLVESISYWKAACPGELVVEAGALDPEQREWFHDLFLHGLGEFFSTNGIDFTADDFLRIHALTSETHRRTAKLPADGDGDLVLIGGGKDSVVTLELLKSLPSRKCPLLLNPARSMLDSAKLAGYTEPIIVRRRIDPKLLELNAAGYLNGHTPFSAYLAFLATLVGSVHGFRHVVASNEASASEANERYLGLDINHQYSKSHRFEARFRDYSSRVLQTGVEYFSFLRPLLDLQISRIFCRYPQHFSSFRSCNAGQREDRWCGACPKCAFVALCVFPFAAEHELSPFFGSLLARPEIEPHLRDLVGLGERKPFECVGTIAESRAALVLTNERFRRMGRIPPSALTGLEDALKAKGACGGDVVDAALSFWSDEHFLPSAYETLLREAIAWR